MPLTARRWQGLRAHRFAGLKATDVATIAISVIAVVLSVVSYIASERTTRDVASVQALTVEYSLFADLAKLQTEHPEMNHLFATSRELYDKDVALVRIAIDDTAVAKRNSQRARRLLEEQGVAMTIFDDYEEAYFYSRFAADSHDALRTRLLQANVDYFRTLLCNPRLRWYWQGNGGMRLSVQFSSELNTDFQTSVLPDCSFGSSPNQGVDADGPF